MAFPIQLQPPWEIEGLPYGLTENDLRHVHRVLDTGLPSGRILRLPDGLRGAPYLYGTGYPHNWERLEALKMLAPARHWDKRPVYPAVLVPDPYPCDELTPVGVVSHTGYLGSVYRPEWSAVSQEVCCNLQQKIFFACEVSISPNGVQCLALGMRDRQEISDNVMSRTIDKHTGLPKLHLVLAPGGGELILRICLDETGDFMSATDPRLPALGIYISYLAARSRRVDRGLVGNFAPGAPVTLRREINDKGKLTVGVYDATGSDRAGAMTINKAEMVLNALDSEKEIAAVALSGSESGEPLGEMSILAAAPPLLNHLLNPRPLGLPLPHNMR